MKIKLFENTSDYTVIIGCGRLGANIANTLSDEESNVLIIDKDKSSFRKLSPSYGGLMITGDGTDFDVLSDAQIEKATAVVVVTNNDNINVMIAQIAKEIFNVNHVIARLYDHEREFIYKEFNIDTICPAILSANEINKFLLRSSTKNEKSNHNKISMQKGVI
jgi:trk system potassium uptake protein TrkA